MIRRFGRGWRERLRSATVTLWLGLAVTLCARGAWAKSATLAVVVEGAGAAAVREMALAAVPQGANVVDSSAFEDALVEQGQKGPFGKKLDGAGHAAAVRRVRAAATARSVDAVVLVRVARDKSKRRRVRMLVVETADGETPVDDVWIGLGDGDDDRAPVVAALSPALEKFGNSGTTAKAAEPAPAESTKSAGPASGPADETAAPGADVATPASNRPRGVLARSLFDAEVGLAIAGRHFNYSDPITNDLRSYDLGAAPLVVADGEVFPLADAHGVLRDIGIVGTFARSLSLSSTLGSEKISSAETSYSIGARVRIHPAGDLGPIVGISDSYASQSFTFDSTGTLTDSQVPSVNYQANRTAVDGRIPFGIFSVVGGVGFRAVFNAGQVAARFRVPTLSGVDAELGVAVAVASGFEARLVGDYERYFYTFKPALGDAFVAGGALDQFFGGRLAVAYIF